MSRMPMLLTISVVLILSLVTGTVHLYAQGNKFGIHVAVPTDEDLDRAQELVNGGSGAYGYVVLVIQETNRDLHHWQAILDKLRELKLIPIIRLATSPIGENWRAPGAEDAREWVRFLGSLNWVTKSRHVVIFNEPNHASEWGGAVDPAQYGKVAAEFAYELKKQSSDYIVMLAGLDLAAPESRPIYADAQTFLQESLREFCAFFTAQKLSCRDHVDAIASHSYPNPGFAGSPYDYGRTSIRGYEFEIRWFEDLTQKTLPVYITETGWDAGVVGQERTAGYFATAFEQCWLPDDRIMAVTPFLLNYQGDPFLPFSFFTQSTDPQPYPKYNRIRAMDKVYGTPEIIDTAVIRADIPQVLVEDSVYELPVIVKNTGQAIGEQGEYELRVSSSPATALIAEPVYLPRLIPGAQTSTSLTIHTNSINNTPTHHVSVELHRQGSRIAYTTPQELTLKPRPTLFLVVRLLSKGLGTDDDFEVQIFDSTEHLVYKRSPIRVTLGRARVEDISNIIPGKSYRVVILKPYYLPRQVMMTMQVGENTATLDTLLPFDFDRDGKLSLGDMRGMFVKEAPDDLSFFGKFRLLLP